MNELVEKYPDVNLQDDENHTILHNSVLSKNQTLVKELIKQGADVTITNNLGLGPLHSAVENKLPSITATILNYSEAYKVQTFINQEIAQNRRTPLHLAAQVNCLQSAKELLSHGANYQARDAKDYLPLHLACDDQMKNLLLSVDDDMNLAAIGDHKKLEIKMEKYTDTDLEVFVHARNSSGHTTLEVAIHNNRVKTAFSIVAVRINRLAQYFDFIPIKVMKNIMCIYQRISLYQARLVYGSHCGDGLDMTSHVITLGQLIFTADRIVKNIDAGVNSEDRPKILFMIEDTLSAFGYKPGQVLYDEDEKVIFHGQQARYCKDLESKNRKTIKTCFVMLIITIVRPLAQFMGIIASRVFIEAAKTNDNELLELINDETYMIDVNFVDSHHQTALHYASKNGNSLMVLALVKLAADVTKTTGKNEFIALHLAVSEGHENVVDVLLRSRERNCLSTFIDMKTKIEGWTALHLAASKGYLTIVKKLMSCGAEFSIMAVDNSTPAKLSTNPEVKAFLTLVNRLFCEVKESNDENIFMRKLSQMSYDELIAAGNARNSLGETIVKVAEKSGKSTFATLIRNTIQKVTPLTVHIHPTRANNLFCYFYLLTKDLEDVFEELLVM